ncbi:MAG: Ig-like domain-containing protein [Candidatus Promineofilum sp.]|nr:Ig-like domain-containing protein [Promineifilum sp.]MBP9656300.1 Ig-like domain-containing protein [Promineifilum sp.]
MRRNALTQIVLLTLALLLALAACRRGRQEATPTPETVGSTETQTPADTAEPEPSPTTKPATVNAVPPEAIDWPPQVVTSDPLPGQEIAIDTPITLRFDQPMNQTSVEAAFSVEPPVDGQLSWPEPSVAVFTPAKSLAVGQSYLVRVANTANALNGQTLQEAVEFAIQTTGPLRVSQYTPSDGSGSVQTDAIITVVFNKPVVPLVSSGEQAGLPQPLIFDPPASGTGEWTSTSIYRFIPDPALAGATNYTVSVDPALTDITGSVIEDAPTFRFTTIRPDVVTIEPADMAMRIAPTTPITVTFNMPMDPATTEAATDLRESGGAAVTLNYEWLEDGRVVVMTPAEPLPLNTVFNLTVGRSAASANGQATKGRDHTSRFTMVPFPAVIRTVPADGMVADFYQRGISIEFASPMVDATIEDQIIITPDPGNVDYFFNQWEGSYSARLEFHLDPETEYTVTVPATAADPYGNTLGQPYTFTFTAAPYPSMASLNLPPQAAQLSTSFPTNVQIMYRNVSRLDVSLYETGVVPSYITNPYLLMEPHSPGALVFETSIPVEMSGALGIQTVELAGGGALPTGLYELRVNTPELDDDSRWWQNRVVLLVVADTNLVIKEMFGEVNVWATDLATGEPVSGLNLALYHRSGYEDGAAVTDADGFARFAYEPNDSYLGGVTVVSNQPGEAGFGAATTNWDGGIRPWRTGISTDTSREQAIYAYIYTDRPIYRPGDTVHFKGIVRNTGFGRFSLPSVTSLDLTINPDFYWGEETFKEKLNVTVDEDGVFSGDYVLPDDMSLGSYSFAITGDYWLSNRSFTVAEYRTPEFMVSVTPETPELLRGQATSVEVNATYLFGGSAAGLPVSWTAYEKEFVPEFDTAPGYVFNDQGGLNYEDFNPFFGFGNDGTGQTVASGDVETDAAGNATVSLPANLLDDADEGSRLVTVEANVGGLGEFPISGRSEITFHAADAYVGLRALDYLATAGKATTFDLLTVDWSGDPVVNRAVEVVYYERKWKSERVSDYDFYSTRWTPIDTEVHRESVTTDGSGKASLAFAPESGGSYIVAATLTDSGGRRQFSSLSFWSIDADFAGWRTDPNERSLELKPDKTEYRAGETAHILVQSPFAQTVNAWLVIERGNIIEQRVVEVSGSTVLDVPISEEFAPNVHVTVAVVKPVNREDSDFPYADIRIGFAELTVPPDQFDLNVTITPGAEEYMPGSTATFDVAVTDQAGNPVQAEISLALVDLGVLLLKEDNAPPILDAFYTPQPLRSNTGSGLLITGEGRAIEEPLPGGGGMGGGGDGAMALESARLPGEDEEGVRKDFKDTAFWEAQVMTDANGRVSVEVPLPDNVTTWRMNSKAATTDTRVGQSYADILARLPLIVRPVTPRFFTVGDSLSLSANVNNNTDAPIEAAVSLDALGLVIDGEATQTVTVPADGRVLVSWPVTIEDVQFADITFRVEGGGFSDASKPTMGVGPDALLPVYRYDGRDFVATAGELNEAGRRVEALILPQGVNTREGEVLIRLQPSLAAAIIESFDIVNDPVFPFFNECAGSLSDRLLHNTAIEKAIRDLNVDQAGLAAALAERNAGDASKLAALQMGNGGWGWCFSGESDPWISAQSVLALTRANELGYSVSSAVLGKGAGYLTSNLTAVGRIGNASAANRQAFFLYVLAQAGKNVVDHADELLDEHRALMDPYAKALLALAYEASGESDENQQALLADLNDEVIMSATGAHWEDAEQDFLNLSSDIRGTAMVIDALSLLQPDSPLLPPAVRWIMVAREAETWSTLHTTAWSVFALSDWMVASGELEPDYAYELLLNLASQTEGTFTPDDATASETVEIPVSDLVVGDTNFFDFQRGSGNGRLYYTLRLNSAIAVDQIDPISRGFTVERQYFDAACDPEAGACEPINSIPAGGQVRVELTIVVSNDRVFVTVEDPIPSGTDAIDPNLLTSQSGRAGGIVPAEGEFAHGFWGWWYFDHIQYRDEKVVFLSQFLPAGTYQYSYYLQSNIPGTYQVMPATAREQYFPEVFGRSEGMIFTITK